MSLIKSCRNRDLLLLENFTFSKSRELKSGEISWRCVQRKCSATAVTMGADVLITKANLIHNHEVNIQKLNRKIVTNACKRKAEEDISEKPAKIIRQAIVETAANNLTLSDIEDIRRNIYTCRRKVLPGVLPKNIEEIHRTLDVYSPKTNNGEDFLFFNDPKHHIIIFSCQTNIHVLCQINTIYMDGTFSYCTKYFGQLFTIHGLENGHYIPLVYCLLKDKTTSSYQHLFSSLKSRIFEVYKLCWNPMEVFIDFEKAIHNALFNSFPHIKINGCRFHLHQNWFKKIQSLGLVREFNNKESDIGKWMRHTFGLTYLAPEEVEDCYVFDLMSYKPNNESLDKYADYLLEVYIMKGSQFPPTIWADKNASVMRTTNACESFHSRFNSSFYAAHPSLYVFVQNLIEFQMDTYIKINSINKTAKIKDKIVKNKIAFLERMIQNVNSNQITRLDFVKLVSYHSCYNNGNNQFVNKI